MNIKRYRINWHDWDVEVEIDHDVMTNDKLHEINNFWTSAEDRLAAANADITSAVLAMLAGHLLRIQMAAGWTTAALIEEFNWRTGAGHEGWPKMDGSYGIKILSADIVTFEPEEMYIREIKEQAK